MFLVGADLCVRPDEGAHAGAPLRKFLAHQVFPGGDDRPQKFRLALPLGLGDEEVAVARGHQQALSRHRGRYLAGLNRCRNRGRHDLAGPDQELPALEKSKGAGVGVGHGPDEIIGLQGRMPPVNMAVRRGAAAVIGGPGVVLGKAGRGTGPQQRVSFPHQFRRRRGHFGEQGQGRVFEGDGNAL